MQWACYPRSASRNMESVGRGSTPTIFPPIEFQRQHHSSKNEHDAHLPTKPPQSTLLLQRGDEHTFEVECA